MKPSAPSKRPALDIETLWQLQRVGAVALAPDGERAVCTVSTPSMADNRSSNRLWLLHTDGRAPRPLTQCGDKDGAPAWSPQGDRIAFLARREQQGRKDDSAQLYLISPDGGEAARASDFAPGIEAFKWHPDGRSIVFAAWVWPGLKGAAAQAKAYKAWTERKTTGYATSQAYYRFWDHNIPEGRVLHLLRLDLASGRVNDLFEGTALELQRDDGGNSVFDISPDGRRLAFVHDPAPEPQLGNPLALSEMDLRSRRVQTLLADAAWDISAPCYHPDGRRIAVCAAHVGMAHTAFAKTALVTPGQGWALLGDDLDLYVNAPLRWAPDGQSLYYTAEQRGRGHLWRQPLAGGAAQVVHEGGWMHGFDVAADTVLVAADSALHPVRVLARRGAAAPRRLESFNDALLAGVALGEVKPVRLTGALGDEIEMWLAFPPGFNPKKKHPILHVIHGGPYGAAGDTFGYRWNVHLLASQGHVVAQVNFHGSSSYGWAFHHSLMGRQGVLELQDIEAGTDWLLQQRWADASQVFASGGSYGGFMVAWMNGHVPAWPEGRYRAYVCHAGVFDRVATFSADSYPARPKDLGAKYWEDLPKVLAQSPANFAGAMTTPTLVIHGAKDYRVPDCNGLAYYNTLKARGVDARLLWFPDENHWILKPQNSRQWYGEFHAWLKLQAAPRKPALQVKKRRAVAKAVKP